MTSDRIDEQIDASLEALGRHLGFERTSLLQIEKLPILTADRQLEP